MQTYVLDWAKPRPRWAPVNTAIAWIGASFCFVFLHNSLTKLQARELVDKCVFDWSAGATVSASLGLLVACWFEAGAPLNRFPPTPMKTPTRRHVR